MTSEAGPTARVGLVGGMSWHSSALYYERLNAGSEARFGVHANVESVLVTVRFRDLLDHADRDDWNAVAAAIAEAAQRAERAGAGLVLLTAFTAHFAAEAVAAGLGVPLLHAGDALAAEARRRGFARIGLIGTAATLRSGAIAGCLAASGIEAVSPDDAVAGELDRVIREDLTVGAVSERAGLAFDRAVADVAGRGAEAVALACTELPLLLPRPSILPLIDGVDAHVALALDACLTS